MNCREENIKVQTKNIVIENCGRLPIHRSGCTNIQNNLRQLNTNINTRYLELLKNINSKYIKKRLKKSEIK